MDFTKLRAQAMRSGEDEEAVTVNTRALIDKVLARYSGEWTTLRELLQNAADAQATTVKIKFETLPSAQIPLSNTTDKSEILKHILLNHTLKRLMVVNDGQVFGPNDWSRLKRIAEGNPDETKIGAFGVGFYSVFADCEEPFVSSGREAMAFYWKQNSLFTRKIQVPESSDSGLDTTFVLDYRSTTSPVPNLLSICQFLATSLTFVALQNIELWLDDWKILSLQKKTSPGVEIPISRDVDTKTKEGLMKVQSLAQESVQMDATFMNVAGWKPSATTLVPKTSSFGEQTYGGSEAPSLRSFFSRLTNSSTHTHLKTKAAREEQALQEIVLEDLTAITNSNVFLRVTTASIRTSVSTQFAAELERATKKPPPKTTKLAILTSTYDESQVSKTGKEGAVVKGVDIFASVHPGGKSQRGRVFIGFPTSQSTGAGMHLSAPSVIPTVERESIDLNARWVRTWNIEMLRVAGIMSRLAFTSEMHSLSENVNRAAERDGRKGRINKNDIAKFLPEALHILNSFSFNESTPSAQVGQIIEEAFWTAYKKPSIEIYSTMGVLQTTAVRIATDDFRGFVDGIPVIPDALVDSKFVTKIKDFGLITEIRVADVKKELSAKALTKEQLIQFIGWAGKKAFEGDIAMATVRDLLDSAVATIGEDSNQGGIVALSTIKYFRNPSKIPADVPVPPDTIAFELTKATSFQQLQALGWEALEVVPWVRFLCQSTQSRNGLTSEQDITWSPKFAALVLAIISKQWESFSQSSRESVVSMLQPLTVIPTKLGMKIPSEAYFANVKLFDDLPTVAGCQGVKEKVLAALGVRKTVDLDTIFQRLLSPTPTALEGEKAVTRWSHVDLIKYLASVKDDIPDADLKKLRTTPICAAEAGGPGQEASQETSRRYKISELFEPKDDLRQLGLPILQWPSAGRGEYRSGSPEGRFLSQLGLRAFPSVPELVEMMASTDISARSKAMAYFIANHQINNYAAFNLASSTKEFLPLQGNEKRLVSPGSCFVNPNASLLGFSTLRRDLIPHANKFGVSENPPMTECVNRLIANPPADRREATTTFAYFSTRLGEIGQNHTAKIGDALIVPVADKTQQRAGESEKPFGVKHITPRMCFIGDSSIYRDIFDFVDFTIDANTFLLHCGSKHEPSRSQVANQLASEPARVLGIVQSPEKYLSLLKTLADALDDLKRDKALFKKMKSASFLLATKHITGKAASKSEKDLDVDEDDDETDGILQYALQPASKICIVDDYNTYRLFREALLCAPFDDTLERFYLALGSSTISSLVQDDVRLGSPVDKPAIKEKIQKRILERAKLFLHEYPNDQLRHTARWLEKNLNIEIVSNITLRRSLRGYTLSHTAKQTATLNHDMSKGWVLWITLSYDMYHISQALVTQLLTRPNNQATTLFEFLLTSDLQGLKRRGYNVERILRAQAVDNRIAESERQKQMEAEQAQIKEQEERWKQSNQEMVPAAAREERRNSTPMPGAFGNESPEESPVQQQKQKKSRGLFSNLTRRLGIDSSGDAQQQLQDFLGGSQSRHSEDNRSAEESQEGPPPYDQAQQGQSQNQVSKAGRGGQPDKITSPHALHQNLVNAIQSSRAHDSSSLFSPPQTNQVKEQASYCDDTPSHNINYLGDTKTGMRIFVSKSLSTPSDEFLSKNVGSINQFSQVLVDVADIYALPRKAMHIFYDEAGSTIAFNSKGSVFCNFRFFQQLHAKSLIGVGGAGEVQVRGKVDATSWWWVVVAHELAHNLVSDHSAEHSYYTESFISQYFSKMMHQALAYGGQSQPLREPLLIE